jgi:hypothetical protein
MAKEITPHPERMPEITLDEVKEALTKALKEVDWGKRYLEKYKIRLMRTPYQLTRFDKGDPTEILRNSMMFMSNSKYSFIIGETVETSKAYEKYAKRDIASFNIHQMPSLCAACVFTYARVHEALRNQGLGDLLHRWRLYLAEDVGRYSIALCSAITGPMWFEGSKTGGKVNSQEKILNKNGWERVYHVINPKSDNPVGLFTKRLTPRIES